MLDISCISAFRITLNICSCSAGVKFESPSSSIEGVIGWEEIGAIFETSERFNNDEDFCEGGITL